MGRKGRAPKEICNKRKDEADLYKTLGTEEEKNLLVSFALSLAQQKYDYENQREQELVHQSGQMQTAFSFMTAALFMALPIAIEHRGNLPMTFFFCSSCAIVFFLLVSLLLASLATWRWKKYTMANITDIKSAILEKPEARSYLDKVVRDKAQIDQMELVQVNKEKINDKRVSLIIASMISFYLSIACIIVCFVISVWMLLY